MKEMYVLNDEDWGDSLTVEEIEMKWSILDEIKKELAKFVHSETFQLYIGKRETHYFAVILKENASVLNIQIHPPSYGFYGRFIIDRIKTGNESLDCLVDKKIEMDQFKNIINALM